MDPGKPTINYNVEDDDESNIVIPPKVENTTFSTEKKKNSLYVRDKYGEYITHNLDDVVYALVNENFKYEQYKQKVSVQVELKKNDDIITHNFRLDYLSLHKGDEIKLDNKIRENIDKFQGPGYDYVAQGVKSLHIYVLETKPALGKFCELPPDLKTKRQAILNIENKKHNCLLLAITASFHPVTTNPKRESNYVKNLVKITDINNYDQIEKDLKINLFFYEPVGNGLVKEIRRPYEYNPNFKNVLILCWNGHCALIKKIESLIERPNNKHEAYPYCVNCRFWMNKNHQCKFETKIKASKQKHLVFKNHHMKESVDNIIYGDIESMMIDEYEKQIGDNTLLVYTHQPIAIGFSYNGTTELFFGPDCIERCCERLLEIERKLHFKFLKTENEPKEINMTVEDEQYHENNNTCHICKKPCTAKVRDHCHETGKYRGPACKICNLNYKQKYKFHSCNIPQWKEL